MNKTMFITCAVFTLISSCKNYVDLNQGIKTKS